MQSPIDPGFDRVQHFARGLWGKNFMIALRLTACVALLALCGCSSALGPDASVRVTNSLNTPGSAVNLYWPCLLNVPNFDVYRVEIDGKDVGELRRCGYGRFQVAEGRHAIRLRSPMMLDFAGALGLKGPEYTIPRGAPIYIRLTYFQYVEYQQVTEDVGRREIARMISD
jgi:hypothetical protein